MSLTVSGKCTLWLLNDEVASVELREDASLLMMNMEDGVQINIDLKLLHRIVVASKGYEELL